MRKLEKYLFCVLFLFSFATFAQSQKQAQLYVELDKISEAITEYARLTTKDKDKDKVAILEEYAYALALGGMHRQAMIYLDRVNIIGGDADFPFYIAQVFSLMGKDSIAVEFWTETNNAPAWIARNYKELLQKHKYDDADIFDADLAYLHANQLASQGMFLQSIMLYHSVQELIEGYTNEYLPYLSSSVAWERLFKYKKAAMELNKSIELMQAELQENPDTTLANALPDFENHLQLLQIQAANTQGLNPPKVKKRQTYNPQLMLYAGGLFTLDYASFNTRVGVFISNSFNVSLNFGFGGNYESDDNPISLNLGLSAYYRVYRVLFVGFGFSEQFNGEGNNTFSLNPSIGVSIVSKSRKSSWDIFFNVYCPLKSEAFPGFGFSIGKSFYLGRRNL
ncbi:MAG: hypothetical protein LBG80_20870 [Bacteroidales bacterium]|jgi:tetratricopeptide (TPR) repeat protein|nr:hypothetical protein [Bacteroidales bacterium]